MDQRIDRIEAKIDKICESIAGIDKTLHGQHGQLKEHIRRTNALESRVEQVANSVEPIKTHVAMLNGALKFIGALSVLVGVAVTVLKFFYHTP